MNLAHVHLLLNHFPTVGMVIGVSLFIVALIGRSDDLKRASMGVFLFIALIALPTYMSGNAAQEKLHGVSGISEALIVAHQSWALLAFIVMEIAGAVAWLALWKYRRTSHFAGWHMPIMLILTVATLGLMANAANIGGEIRHPEILDPAIPQGSVNSTIQLLNGVTLGKAIKSETWIWATCETLHFMGLSMLFGVVLLVNLRMLGVIKGISYAALHQMLPWAVGAFALNTFTGMVFFIAAADQYTTNPVFHWKLALIMVAGLNAIYFTVVDEPWDLEAGDPATGTTKAIAVSALALWIGIIFCGHMLPFIGNAF
jgi:hypothetical protein